MNNRVFAVFWIGLIIAATNAHGQDTTLGLIYHGPGSFEGYTLMDPLRWPVIYLIDNDGQVVHLWETDQTPGDATYLLETGNIVRCAAMPDPPARFNIGGAGGLIQEFSWDGDLLWEYTFASDTAMQHHDIEWLPNGNVLLNAWEFKTYEEAILAGRDSALISQNELYPDMIVELRPIPPDSAEIVWVWHLWDHLIQDYNPLRENYGVVAEHPEKMDLNYTAIQFPNDRGVGDWNHMNAIDYNAELNQIVVSLREQSEVIVIDHSTTTEEAAGSAGGRWGRGGDILYRWGNPQAYGMGTAGDRKLYFQHDVSWVPSGYEGQGNLLVFNNGRFRPGSFYSSVEEIRLPITDNGDYHRFPGSPFGPPAAAWTYYGAEPGDFYSGYLSGVRRLPNGNTLICSGSEGKIFEVGDHDEIVWLYVNPCDEDGPHVQGSEVARNQVFRASRYAPDHPGLLGRDLTPMGPIELYGAVESQAAETADFSLSAFPNPFNSELTLSLNLTHSDQISIAVYDLLGREVSQIPSQFYVAGSHDIHFSATGLASGTYYAQAKNKQLETTLTRIMLVR